MPVVYSVPTCLLLKTKLVNGMVIDTPVDRSISNKYWLRGRLTFPFSDLIIGNSYAGLEAYKAPPNKSVCIYNGMDFERFEGLKNPCIVKKEILGEEATSFFIVGMVAAFEDRKDYKTLIKAAISLLSKNNSLRFILVGDGATFTKIKNSVPPECSDKIIFLGRRSDVETIVNIFDIGILLTDTAFHGEGISNSIIEYMALSKPVIATAGGGTNEVVFDSKNGYLLNPYDDKQLVEKIEMLIHNKEKRFFLGKNGHQIAKEKFDLKIMQDNYMQAYNNLLNEKKK
jgi:glycosyltransferase involved in cell wall biosynthesis